MALGAQRRDILQLVLGEEAKMAMVGAAIGVAASLGLARLMTKQLFGVSAHDPLTYAIVARSYRRSIGLVSNLAVVIVT